MATKPNKPTTNNGGTKAVSFLAANAMSADIGKKAMEDFGVAKQTDAAISEMTAENSARKGATLKALTLAFVKAATADKGVNLGHVQSDVDKEVSQLRQKLEVAVGIRVANRQPDGTDKVELAPWTSEFLPQPGENKESDEWRKKENFRTNFSAVFKKAMGAAHAIMLKGITASEDKKTGHLLISGKTVKERFGTDSVLLNEKREYKEGDRKVTLNKIPSFTELARISAESVGKTLQTRVDSRAKTGGPVTEADIIKSVQSLQVVLTKLKGFGDDLATALEGLQDTIEKALNENEGSEAA